MLGLPGKPDGIDGGEVEKYFHEGRIKEIADYCESDALQRRCISPVKNLGQ
jgi:predicted PolB exonuclease-like 3'-5' exonuclease